MIVSTTGYIIACIGPFFSDFSNNDASIIKNVLLNNMDNILNWLKEVVHFLLYLWQPPWLSFFLEWRPSRGQRISRRYWRHAEPWFGRFYATFSEPSTTILHRGIESIPMHYESSMDRWSGESTHQRIQVLCKYSSELVVDVLASRSFERLCFDQSLSTINYRFEPTEYRYR